MWAWGGWEKGGAEKVDPGEQVYREDVFTSF